MADPADPGSANESAEKELLPTLGARPPGSEPAGSRPPNHGYLSFGERGRRAAAERKARGLELDCHEAHVEELVDLIRTAARTGQSYAGWIYVGSIDAAIPIT